MDFKQHVECFKNILDNFHIAEFLRKDRCGALCDKYHLIIVFQFFMRAEFKEKDYTPRNFFLALTLSHDLHDESKILKHIILTYYLSRNDGFRDRSKIAFHWDKLYLFKRMQYKGLVKRKICRKLCQLVLHKAFDKNRRDLHTGFITNKILCDKCLCPMNKSLSINKENNAKAVHSDRNTEKADTNKTSVNVEDVSAMSTEQKSKKLKNNIIAKARKHFFRDCEPKLFAVEEKSVTCSHR